MQALDFWRTVVADRSDFLSRVIELLTTQGIGYCVLGGQGVNAYAEPVVSLDLDIVIAVDQIEKAEELLGREFRVERFPRSLNVSARAPTYAYRSRPIRDTKTFLPAARRATFSGSSCRPPVSRMSFKAKSGLPSTLHPEPASVRKIWLTSRA